MDGVWNGGIGVMFGEDQNPKTNNKQVKKHSQLIKYLIFCAHPLRLAYIVENYQVS